MSLLRWWGLQAPLESTKHSWSEHMMVALLSLRNWSSFLEQYFNKVPHIKKYHHFRFSKDDPGKLYFKEFDSSPEQSLMLLKNRAILPPPSVLPPKINPGGLNQQRKQYLYRKIRQLCKPGTKDLIAPAPLRPPCIAPCREKSCKSSIRHCITGNKQKWLL